MINPVLIFIVALGSAISQGIGLWHDVRDKGYSIRHTLRIVALVLTITGAILSANNAYTSYREARPRVLPRGVSDTLQKTFAQGKGLYVQVVGAGLVNTNETCGLRTQLDDIFAKAGWHVIFGACNQYPDRTDTNAHMLFDQQAADSVAAIQKAMNDAGIKGLTDGQPATDAQRTVLDIPFNGMPSPSERGTLGTHVVDLIVIVYDKQQ